MSSYPKVYVEGSDDNKFLDQLFVIDGEFQAAGNKKKTQRAVQQDGSSFGIVDRDFDTDDQVAGSRVSGSRCSTLSRYCMENYLLEPTYLHQFAIECGFADDPDWDSPAAIERLLITKAQELCHHAAANEQLSIFRSNIAFQEIMPYFVKPQEQPIGIRDEMRRRMEQLPCKEDLVIVMKRLEQRAAEITKDCQILAGVNRWINGKILLRDVIYQEVITAFPDYRKLKKKYFVDDLAQIAKRNPPQELAEILNGFGIAIQKPLY